MVVRWLLAVAVLVRIAHAEPASEADRLFAEGRAFAEAGDHAAACARFEQSYALDPAVGTKLNLGDCREHLGKLQEALHLFEEAAAEYERQGEAKRATFARDRARAVRGKLVTVIVQPAEPTRRGLAITVAGTAIATDREMRAIVEPGTISIVASVPDQPTFSTSVTAAAGASVIVAIPAFGKDAAPAMQTRRSRSRVHLAWWLAAGGAGAAVASGLLTLKARSDYNGVADGTHCMRVAGGITCDDSGRSGIHDAQRLADIGTVFAVASGALLAAGIVVYVTAPDEQFQLSPVVSSDGAGVVGRFTF